MEKINARKVLIAIGIFFVLLIASGIILGVLYSALPQHHPQDSQKNCESVGGEWVESEQFCLLGHKKAGESCTDGGQCESGVCFPPALTNAQRAALLTQPLDNIVGTCYPDEDLTGCIEQVLLGTITKESMCLEE
ncbi:MAG: hypothetical protein ABIG66_02665 [Candidatus Kerfeldbacteria bacterium]